MAFLQGDDMVSLADFYAKCCEELQSLSGQLIEQVQKLEASGVHFADGTDGLFKKLDANCIEAAHMRKRFIIPYILYLLAHNPPNTNYEASTETYPANYPAIMEDRLAKNPLKDIFIDINYLIDQTGQATSYPQHMSVLQWLLTLLQSRMTQIHFLEATYLKSWMVRAQRDVDPFTN